MWDDTRSAIDVARELPIGLPSVADREERRTALLAAWEPAQIASEVAAVQPARGLTPEPSSGETAFVDSLRARRRRRILAVVVAAAASLAAVMLAARGPLPPPSVVATHPRRGVVHPHEGAQFTLAAQPPDEIVRLRDGVIDIDVDPLMLGERFRVVVGADEVEVHGTSFQVVAAADRLVSVRVVHGRVEVRRIGAPPAFVIGGGAWHSTTVTGLESPAPPPTASVATTLPNRSSPPGRLPRGVIRPPGSSALDAVAQPPASTTAVPHRANPQEVAFARGWEAMGQGELGQAAASFQRAIALAPDGALAEECSEGTDRVGAAVQAGNSDRVPERRVLCERTIRCQCNGTLKRSRRLTDPTGLATWSIDDIVAALKTNTEKGTARVFCNTHPGGPELLGKMTDADVRDIASYLHTLPPISNGPFTCVP